MTALGSWLCVGHHTGRTNEKKGQPWQTGTGRDGGAGRQDGRPGAGGGETGGEGADKWWDGVCVSAACLPVPLWAAVLLWTEKFPQESFNSVQPLQLQPELQELVPVCLSDCLSICLTDWLSDYLTDWPTLSLSSVLCTAPSLYRVVEAEGSVRAKSCVDL